jgi:hypothetical protein
VSSEAFVDRVRLSAVGLAHPPGEAILVAADHLDAPVRGTAVDHDVLDRLVVLLQYRPHRLLQELALIERRSDDADERSRHPTDRASDTKPETLRTARPRKISSPPKRPIPAILVTPRVYGPAPLGESYVTAVAIR